MLIRLDTHTWTTADEIHYLNHIGTHSPFPYDRLELLREYLKALPYRPKSAAYLDMDAIEQRVKELIEKG